MNTLLMAGTQITHLTKFIQIFPVWSHNTVSHNILTYGSYLAKGTGDAGRPLLEDGTSRAFCKDPCKILKKTWKLMQLNFKTLKQACAKKPHQTHATCKPRKSRR
jgi:hypothetical protein